ICEVPNSVLPRLNRTFQPSPSAAAIRFNYTTSPFSFTFFRTSTRGVFFATASPLIIFELQYLRVKTALPPNADICCLGEHADSFHLPTFNMTRALWSRDACDMPTGPILCCNPPVYFEHRYNGPHGVFLFNSNGMDVRMTYAESTNGGVTLEYDVLGGVLDFYFLAGSGKDPLEMSGLCEKIVGTLTEVPHWSFRLHQCRFGYTRFIDVANVITIYSAAEIPLETMCPDIDYMKGRQIFTVDPSYLPLPRMCDIVQYLHAHNRKSASSSIATQ
ncbi:glycoside hydrolase family 31 protein, partial [Collybiopsis luxurians FD-317 M1]